MDNPILFSICAFLMLMVLLSWVGYRLFYKPNKLFRQLGRPVITSQQIIENPAEPEASTIVTVLRQIGQKMPSSDQESATLRSDLIRAGFRSEAAAPVFYGLRIVATLVMLVVSLMLEPKMPPNPVMKIALLFSGCAAGWILPRFVLEKKVTKRQVISIHQLDSG